MPNSWRLELPDSAYQTGISPYYNDVVDTASGTDHTSLRTDLINNTGVPQSYFDLEMTSYDFAASRPRPLKVSWSALSEAQLSTSTTIIDAEDLITRWSSYLTGSVNDDYIRKSIFGDVIEKVRRDLLSPKEKYETEEFEI